jgi:SSS family solute:Na+ symporter
MVIISLLTEKPDLSQLNGLTYATTVAEDKAKSRASWGKLDVIVSIIIIALILAAFLYFSPLGIAR